MSAKVLKKLLAVQKALKAIPKNDKNDKLKYAYWGIDQIIPAASDALAAEGLVLLQNVVGEHSSEPNGTIPRRVYQYEFILADAESGESITFTWIHDVPLGMSSYDKWIENDKSAGAAHSYAQKYFLVKLLMIVDKESVENDVDAHGNSEKSHQQAKPASKPAATPVPQQAQQGNSTDVSFVANKITTSLAKNGKTIVYSVVSDKGGKATTFKREVFESALDAALLEKIKAVGEHAIPPTIMYLEKNGEYWNIVGAEPVNPAPTEADKDIPF